MLVVMVRMPLMMWFRPYHGGIGPLVLGTHQLVMVMVTMVTKMLTVMMHACANIYLWVSGHPVADKHHLMVMVMSMMMMKMMMVMIFARANFYLCVSGHLVADTHQMMAVMYACVNFYFCVSGHLVADTYQLMLAMTMTMLKMCRVYVFLYKSLN